jgi:hypothetical protein
MQFLSYVLLQIDEACRHIQDGKLAHLRIALLLLDNSAEIQMHRCTTDRLSYEEMLERIRKRAIEIPEGDRPDTLQDLVKWKPLNTKRKHAVHRYFDEKVHYLTERAKQLDSRLAAPLSYLHKYRNEAYHSARVRMETIETAAKLLLDINCELLLNLSRDCTTYASDEDYSWIEQRFCDGEARLLYNTDLVPIAVKEFRAIVDLNDESVAQLLVKHLRSRIQEVFSALEFIVENTRYPDAETAIRDSHVFNEARREQRGLPHIRIEGLAEQHSIKFLKGLSHRLEEISVGKDRFEAFQAFSILESIFEPVEESIQELAAEVDGMIQMQIDIARGK